MQCLQVMGHGCVSFSGMKCIYCAGSAEDRADSLVGLWEAVSISVTCSSMAKGEQASASTHQTLHN